MKEVDEKRVSVWSYAGEIINSGWGAIPYKEWCAKEIDRLASKGIKAEIVKKKIKDGVHIAVARV